MNNELNCGLSKDTELLTREGWMSIQNITTKIPVLQYSEDGFTSFARPIGIRKTYVENAIALSVITNYVKQIIHPLNAVPVVSRYRNWLRAYPANNIPIQCDIINVGSSYKQNINTLSAVEKLKIAFACVGTTSHMDKKIGTVEFIVNNENRLNELISLLNKLCIKYTLKHRVRRGRRSVLCSTMPHTVCFVPNAYKKGFEWINYASIDTEWCVDFINELFFWGGNVNKEYTNSLTYWTNNLNTAHKVQYIATLAGYRTVINEYTTNNNCLHHRIYINKNAKSTSLKNLTKTFIEYNDCMYNVVTPTNMVVTRLNNAVSVTGCYGVDKPKGLVLNREFGH